MIQLTGTLYKPNAEPLSNTKVRLTALDTVEVLVGTSVDILTTSEGGYDFSLLQGTYLVEVLQNTEFTEGTIIQVLVDTVTPNTLATLSNEYAGDFVV